MPQEPLEHEGGKDGNAGYPLDVMPDVELLVPSTTSPSVPTNTGSSERFATE